jgi:hypothetical protein
MALKLKLSSTAETEILILKKLEKKKKWELGVILWRNCGQILSFLAVGTSYSLTL